MPFLMGETTIREYLHRAKFDGSGRNNFAGAPDIFNYMSSHYEHSIFWTFLPKEVYNTKELVSDRLKIGIVCLNIYNFFIR